MISDTRITDIDELTRNFLNKTLEEIMSVTNTECGSLFLFDSANKELVLNSFRNPKNLCLQGLRQKIGEGILGEVANIKAPILVKDIARDVRFRKNGFTHYQTNSFISIPLFTSKGLLAIINLTDKSSGEPFSDKDLEFSVIIAKYASINIENFHHYISLREEKEDLNKQNLLLEKYASVGKLAAGIVHEVNNPLDGITRYTNMLIEQAEDNSILREYLLEVKTGLNRIANITKSLLEFSHQINSATLHNKYINLYNAIEDSLNIFSNRINNNIKIIKNYDSDIPLVLDQGIQHVATNMIKNALDAIPQKGTLEISLKTAGDMLKMSFEDNGIGMPEEIKKRIFEPFFTTKDLGKGTGLGLSICKEIINKYEGTIDLETSPNQGTIFTISIPKKYLKNA